MKQLSIAFGLVCALASVGCSNYASVAATGALVAKNGILGKSVYVCSVTPAGLTNCQSQESP
jgi:hypothetical protein